MGGKSLRGRESQLAYHEEQKSSSRESLEEAANLQPPSVLVLKLGIELPSIFFTFYQLYSNTETLPQDWWPPESIELHHEGRYQSGLKPFGDFMGLVEPANSAGAGNNMPKAHL